MKDSVVRRYNSSRVQKARTNVRMVHVACTAAYAREAR
jgi:hypothetical protein